MSKASEFAKVAALAAQPPRLEFDKPKCAVVTRGGWLELADDDKECEITLCPLDALRLANWINETFGGSNNA